MRKKYAIRAFDQKILGYIEEDVNSGDKTATNFKGQILGHYSKKLNVTRYFNNSIAGRGDILVSLIQEEAKK